MAHNAGAEANQLGSVAVQLWTKMVQWTHKTHAMAHKANHV